MRSSFWWVPLALSMAPLVSSNSLVQSCAGYSFPHVACIDRYGSNMPLDFYRQASLNISNVATYASTQVSNDPSFQQLGQATFLVWDQHQGAEVLGSNPEYDFTFTIANIGHEAPVYVPDTNEVWFSELSKGNMHQQIISLDSNPPTLSEIMTDPPMYAPSGARYRQGKIYFSAGGGNYTLGGGPYHPGIYSVDPKTRKSTIEVNNYFGWYFNQANDMDIDEQGRIWFSDPFLARYHGTSTVAPQVQASVYRYDPATGAVNIVDDTLHCPNGVAFSPDYKTLYLTDTAAGVAMIDPRVPLTEVPGIQYNSTNRRTVYAFDVSSDGTYLTNRRPIYTAMDFVPDGLKVASNGYVITGAGHGVDILDPSGTHLVRIQTNFTAVNMAFAGRNMDELWIVGHGGVARAKLNLTGTALQ